MSMINVKPREGITVRRVENGKIIAADGEYVPDNSYYRRRIKDGDLVDTDATKKAAEKAKSVKAAEKVKAERAAAAAKSTTKDAE